MTHPTDSIGSIPLPPPKRLLCCIRPDGRFARVYVGSYGPTYVWWYEAREDGTFANFRELGKPVGDAFWYAVASSNDIRTYETRDEVFAVHPNFPNQVINIATTERPQ